MTIIPFELVPGFRQAKRKKGKPTPIWRLIDTRTGKTRAEMSNPEYLESVIESLILADLLKQNCTIAGIYLPEMIEWSSLKD